MKTTPKLIAAVLIGVPLAGIAQQPKLSCITDMRYNKEFLAKFPAAGAACTEVIAVNGQKWARFNAEVKDDPHGNHLTVDFIGTHERAVTTITFAFTPNATVTLEDKEVKPASALEKGDKIVVWVPESRFGVDAKPGAAESQQFTVVSN